MKIPMNQVYKITNIQNMRSYIGISICEEQTHMDRFEKHMSGVGGVWIKKDLDDGLATREDFIIELIEEGNEPDEYYRAMEIYYIELFDTLYPKGYNGNKGNYIILTDEIKKKIRDTWNKNRAAGLYTKKTGMHKGWSCWRYPDGQIKWLPSTHPDVINNIVQHNKYTPNSKGRRLAHEKAEQRLANNGYTDAQVQFFQRIKILSHDYINNPSWQEGRERFRQRMAKKAFTAKELQVIQQRPEKTKQQWSNITTTEKMKRVSAGLNNMNSPMECPHCGTKTNKGNFKRWHGNKCKAPKQ